jgi:DNA-directed RNA polymerase specialized sigma24 family protein
VDTEPPAFDSFFEEQKDRLLRTLSVITGSRAKAEDLAQEAFTRVSSVGTRWRRWRIRRGTCTGPP